MSFAKTIFMTGFPGFIAERLVARIARTDVQFFLLVQPQFTEKAMKSVEAIAKSTATPLENFGLIEGDITKINLGISNDDHTFIRSETTDLYHLAAAYDLAVSKEMAFAVNLRGTKNIGELAKSIRGLRRYNYVSTCYVAGKQSGRILETDLEHNADFRNYYEESKYFAEIEVDKLKGELPVTIFRPSVVVGDSETGETAKYDGIYYLIKYLQKAPGLLRLVNVGNTDVRLNLVPVDFVVDAIATLADDANSIAKTIAIADPDPLTTAELFDLIAEKISGKSSAFSPPPWLVQRFLMSPVSPAVTGLPHSGVPYFFLPQTYDTGVATSLLEPHNLACPGFRDYVANILNFVEKHPRL